MRRALLPALLGIVSAMAIATLSSAVAVAVEPKAYWDGPDAIVVQHPFFSVAEENSDSDIHTIDNSKRFTLDRSTRDPFRFVAEGVGVAVSHGDSSCTYATLYFDLAINESGGFAAESQYNYGKGAATGTAGVAVSSSSVKGGWRSVAGINQPCEILFVGGTIGGEDLEKEVHEKVNDLGKPFNIRGDMGAISDISIFKELLGISRENETTRYTHRICGTINTGFSLPVSPIGPAPPITNDYDRCVDQAKKSYSVIWQYCERYAVALHNKYERTESFKSCIQDRSGVDVHASSIDSTLLNIIDYDGGESCTIRYIGWIICPLSRFMASVTDAAFDGLSQFFVIKPLNRGEPAGDSLYQAWSLINNFANVLFIIGFLVVIFSQLTGRGMNNYNIKKLLPKIILTAILVNVSYYICIVAVDLSNIIGMSLKDVIKAIEPDSFTKPSTWSSEVENILVFGGAAAGAAYIVLTASIVAMLPLLVGALLSFLIAVIMMVGRYALILILIILAPVAIACTLLPNTQKWYNQWFKLFSSMLLLFPMISIVFGASQVAGILVLNSSLARSTGDITLQLFGLAIMALPLAITPLLVRLSGGVLNRFGGVVSNNRFFNKTKQRTEDFVQRKNNARDVGALRRTGDKKRGGLGGARDRMTQRSYLRKAQHSVNENVLSNSKAGHFSDYKTGKQGGGGLSATERAKGALIAGYEPVTRGEKFAQDLAKGGMSDTSAQAMAISEQVKINADQVTAAKASDTIRRAMSPDGNMNSMVDIAADAQQDEAIRQAAIELVMENGTAADIAAVVKSSGNMTKNQRRATAIGATSGRSVAQAGYLGQPGVARAIMSGDAAGDSGFTQNIVAPYFESGEYSELSVGTMHHGALEESRKALTSNHVSASTKQSVAATAQRAQGNASIASKSQGTQAAVDKLSEIARL